MGKNSKRLVRVLPAWLIAYRMTNTWAQHRARGSVGGEDWATPTRTPIPSPSTGTLDFRFFSGGESVLRVRRADGSATEFVHATLRGKSNRRVRAGEIIGYTDGRRGSKGAGQSTGPHVHVHDVTKSGLRVLAYSTINSPREPKPPKERPTVSTLYHNTDKKPFLFALAGDSPGTPANWIETYDYKGLAVPWARRHGSSIALSGARFARFKEWYTATLDATSPTASSTKMAADLADELANELAQRLKE